jgi:hypothetical protein
MSLKDRESLGTKSCPQQSGLTPIVKLELNRYKLCNLIQPSIDIEYKEGTSYWWVKAKQLSFQKEILGLVG